MKWLIILLSGIVFGIGLVVSSMTDPAKVIGFLDLFGAWDPTLAWVMGGAVMTFATGNLILRKRHRQHTEMSLPDLSADPINKRLVVGSIIFGVGWGLSGFCPGPALANLAAFRVEAFVFVPMMLIGMFVAQKLLRIDQ